MRYFRQAGLCISIVVFVYVMTRLISVGLGDVQDRRNVQKVRALYQATQGLEQTAVSMPTVIDTAACCEGPVRSQLNRFAPLLERNPDIVGWLKLEDSSIDYPIVQGTDNTYYLTRNYVGKTSRAGSIFMDYRNEEGFDARHVILYGHRMQDGSMFGELKHYAESAYYEQHRYLRIDSLEGTYLVEIFAAYHTTTAFNYIETDFASDETFDQFLEQIQEHSIYPQDVHVTAADQIITLSTCDYILDPNEGRFVVHGRLIKLD